nr:HAD family hydrolase [uncultured Dethiosulfovibrio sp.]
MVLFDFDMTLVDSSQGITDCVNAVASKMGLPSVTKDQVLGIIGIPLETGLHRLWGDYDEAWLAEYRRIFRETEYAGIVPFSDTLPMLEKLRSIGIKVGVATNRQIADPVVRAVGLFDHLDLVMGLGKEYRPKPEPDMILAAMEKLGGNLAETVYVGDTDIDMKTACSAGMRGIGVTSGVFSASQLVDAGAWRILDGVGFLIELVRRDVG